MRISLVLGQTPSHFPFLVAGEGRRREVKIAASPLINSLPLPPLNNQRKTLNPSQFLHQQQKQDSGLLFRQKVLYLEHHLRVDSLKALSKNPSLRSAPLSSLLSVERCLASFSIDCFDMARIFGMHPDLLTCDPHRHLYPVFEFLLDDVAIPYPDIHTAVARCPRLLVSSVSAQLRPTLYFLRRLGFVAPHHAITCQTTLLLVSSVETTLIPKLDYLQSLGFSYREVVNMVLRSPGLLTFSIENNFKPKVEYLVNEMKGEVGDLREFPQYFSFSLEGKIKRRHRMLLQHGFSMRLADMLKVSDGEFNDRLVEMQLERLDDG